MTASTSRPRPLRRTRPPTTRRFRTAVPQGVAEWTHGPRLVIFAHRRVHGAHRRELLDQHLAHRQPAQ